MLEEKMSDWYAVVVYVLGFYCSGSELFPSVDLSPEKTEMKNVLDEL